MIFFIRGLPNNNINNMKTVQIFVENFDLRLVYLSLILERFLIN